MAVLIKLKQIIVHTVHQNSFKRMLLSFTVDAVSFDLTSLTEIQVEETCPEFANRNLKLAGHCFDFISVLFQ